jgi:signal transduction histidine kinase
MVAMRVLAEDAENEAQREALLASRDVAATVLQGIREMAVDLRPPVLDDLGLVSAIRKYVDKFQERLGIMVELEMGQDEMSIPSEGAVALYRILQEGLNNIVKHSKATSIKIHLEISGKFIVLRLYDNGTGISSAIIEQARRENRLGLYGMQERAELMGGNFAIQGLASGGTELKVAIPLQVGV